MVASVPRILPVKLKREQQHIQNIADTPPYPAKIKLVTSKMILFFGKTLSPRNPSTEQRMDGDGLSNDLTIKNLNDFLITYKIVAYSHEKQHSTEAVFSMFKFAPEMYEVDECCNNADTNRMTRLVIDLRPQQEICIKLKFDSSVLEGAYMSSSRLIQNGAIKISANGFNERFNVSLVGFLHK